ADRGASGSRRDRACGRARRTLNLLSLPASCGIRVGPQNRGRVMLEKTYNPSEIELRLYEGWERGGAFACDPNSNAQPYTIMIPPPNVTGSLHMGHALTFTVQDTLIRWRRMQGRDVLWQPGTDHAGIATQMVVERLLGEQGVDRRELGRDKFIERVWQWKAESGGTITRQLRRL